MTWRFSKGELEVWRNMDFFMEFLLLPNQVLSIETSDNGTLIYIIDE